MTFSGSCDSPDSTTEVVQSLLMHNWRVLHSFCCVRPSPQGTVYPKKYAHGFCFAVLWCGYTLTDFPISIRLTSLALWQSNDCPSNSKATLMNMDKYFMSIHYERLHNHNKAKHNETVCIFLGIYKVEAVEQWSSQLPFECAAFLRNHSWIIELSVTKGLGWFVILSYQRPASLLYANIGNFHHVSISPMHTA